MVLLSTARENWAILIFLTIFILFVNAARSIGGNMCVVVGIEIPSYLIYSNLKTGDVFSYCLGLCAN